MNSLSNKTLKHKRGKRKKITRAQKIEYRKYLRSSAWKIIRRQAFDFFGERCGLCGSTQKLEIHHKSYENIYYETMQDLMVLCDRCHSQHHHRENKIRIYKNGHQSRYMRNPSYETGPVTYYPKRALQQTVIEH